MITNFFKKNEINLSNESDFHFPPTFGKKRAIIAIDEARRQNANDSDLLYRIACDLSSIARNGYVIANRFGFNYDYSAFV